MGGETTGGLGTGVPSRVQGRSRFRVWGEVSQNLKNFKSIVTSKLYAFLVVFHTVSPKFFFRACRHNSTKSAKWW